MNMRHPMGRPSTLKRTPRFAVFQTPTGHFRGIPASCSPLALIPSSLVTIQNLIKVHRILGINRKDRKITHVPFRKTRLSSAGLRVDIPHAEMAPCFHQRTKRRRPFPQRGCHGDGGPSGPFAKREAVIRAFCVLLCVQWTPSE